MESKDSLVKKKKIPKRPLKIGSVYGHLTVTGLSARLDSRGRRLWVCKCNNCGAESEYTRAYVNSANKDYCYECLPRKHEKCVHGHSLDEWGRTPSSACRGCVKNKSLMNHYGITLEDYVALWEYQNGKCALCGCDISLQPPGFPGWHVGTRIEVDHKHGTKLPLRKTVRGLLCGGRWAGCNRKLGRLDNAEWLEKALRYVTNPPAQNVLGDESGKKSED